MNDETSLNDIVTPADFSKKYSHLVDGAGAPKLGYLLRTRHINGLSDCGAVVEPVNRRFLIVVPKFLNWLLNRK